MTVLLVLSHSAQLLRKGVAQHSSTQFFDLCCDKTLVHVADLGLRLCDTSSYHITVDPWML